MVEADNKLEVPKKPDDGLTMDDEEKAAELRKAIEATYGKPID